MIDFEPGEDARALVESVRAFAGKELRPRLREFEKQARITPDVEKAFHGLGVGLLSLPESLGGAAMGERLEVLVGEELGAADLGGSVALPNPGSFGLCLMHLGTAEQQQRWLNDFSTDPTLRGAVAWSERTGHPADGMRTTATKKGGAYVLNGEKHPVLLGPHAKRFVVFAQLDGGTPGLGNTAAFVVEKTQPGVTVSAPIGVLALHAAGLSTLTLKDVSVPEDARLVGNNAFTLGVHHVFVRTALRGAARIVGGARAAYAQSVEYAQTRTAFGRPIGHHQGLAFLLADMATAVEGMRWLVWKAAWALDEGQPDALITAARAVAEVQETGMWLCNQAVQVHGGAGFIQDLPLEKWMRDAKAMMSYGLTPQAADALAADGMLELDVTSSLDALPAPSVQPVML